MIRLLSILALGACHTAPKTAAILPVSGGDSTRSTAVRIWKTLPNSPPSLRLEAASRTLLGRPYLLGPLGEGDSLRGETKPRFRMDAFDCVTYLETSLALAVSRDSTAIEATMDSIRYQGGRPEWKDRNHFFEAEWLPRNHRWVRPVAFPDDTIARRRVARAGFYAKKGIPVADTVVDLRMVPRERALSRWSKASDSTRIRGVGLVGKVEGFPVLHTGCLVERAGEPAFLRHASQAGTVREQPFADYLREKPKFVGVVVWDWLP